VVGIKFPVEFVKQQRLKVKSDGEWSHYMASLTHKKIQWQPAWQQQSQLMYQCAKFHNVPLIGTKGCINYNPVLAQRQFGHPIRGAPTSYVIEPFMFPYKDRILSSIRKAWERKVIMGKDTRAYAIHIEKPYQHWLAERVETIKLPFRLNSPTLLEEESEREEE